MKISDSDLAALRSLYAQMDTPTDQIAKSSYLRFCFADRLSSAFERPLDPDEAICMLLYARKRGKLPRLRR